MTHYDSYETDLAVRLYVEQFDPGSCQAIPSRAESEFDASREIVILRSGAKVLATYDVADLCAVEEQWEEEQEGGGAEFEGEPYEPEPERSVSPDDDDWDDDDDDEWDDFEEF
jgi:hypothetical protein